ncbi:MAG TPA: DUF6252 family protein [Flavipsychrobacter sp.]
MKRQLLILTTVIAVLGLFTVVACKKDTTTPGNNNNNNNNNPTTVCSGGNLCFKLDGTQETYTAEWRKIPAVGSNPERYRIYWQNTDGSRNIEMDVYATATGTYNIKSSSPYAANDAAFQYYMGTKNVVGQSGTVEITGIDNTNNTISGKFTVTASDGSATYQVTEGNFENVPLKP